MTIGNRTRDFGPEACSVVNSHFVSDVNKRTLVRRFKQMTTIKVA